MHKVVVHFHSLPQKCIYFVKNLKVVKAAIVVVHECLMRYKGDCMNWQTKKNRR